jgi:DNA-binding CsgD family transcriptional regulator
MTDEREEPAYCPTDAVAQALSSVRLVIGPGEPKDVSVTDAKILIWTTLEVVLSLVLVIRPGGEIEDTCQALLGSLRASSVAGKDVGDGKTRDPHHPAFSLHRAPPADDELTLREQSIMHLVTLGLSNKQIARQLGIGPETVKTHISHILLKLDVRNRAQAAALANSRGLIRHDAVGSSECTQWTPSCETAPLS